MITQTITCDRCHEPITTDRSPISIEAGPYRSDKKLDLCGSCCGAFLDWVDASQVLAMAAGKPKPPVPESMRDVLDRTSEGAVRA